MLKIGFNTHALNLSNPAALKMWVAKNHPTTMLVLNSPLFATQLADLGVPHVILRMTNNDDSIHLKIRSAQEWWDSVKANYADERLIVHFGNEPHTDFDRLTQFSLDLMKIIGNRRAIFGNFSVGTPEVNDWGNSLHPMLEAIASSNGKYFLGLHEYFMGDFVFNVPFEIARYKEVFQFFPNIQIIFTEFGSDIIQDVKLHHPEVGNTRGFRDYNNEDWVFATIQTIFQQFYNVDKQIKGVNFFCYGNSGGWETYNAENSGLLQKFEGLSTKDDQVTQFNQQVTIQSKSAEGARRRTAPTTSAPINGLVTGPIVVTKLAGVGDWTQYKFSDGIYWVNSTVIIERVAGATVSINLYNAPQEDIDRANSLFRDLLALLKKYNADVT